MAVYVFVVQWVKLTQYPAFGFIDFLSFPEAMPPFGVLIAYGNAGGLCAAGGIGHRYAVRGRWGQIARVLHGVAVGPAREVRPGATVYGEVGAARYARRIGAKGIGAGNAQRHGAAGLVAIGIYIVNQ